MWEHYYIIVPRLHFVHFMGMNSFNILFGNVNHFLCPELEFLFWKIPLKHCLDIFKWDPQTGVVINLYIPSYLEYSVRSGLFGTQ